MSPTNAFFRGRLRLYFRRNIDMIEPSARDNRERSAAKSRVRILFLEDSAIDCDLVHHELAREGVDHTITRVVRATEFVVAQETQPFDLILSDIALPGFDGLLDAKAMPSC